MAEFTGERVIPGLVDADLFNEHVSRYKFAARLITEGAHVLDLGCGTGYGTAELAAAAHITGADISPEAIAYARANFGRNGVTFLEASCDAVPLPDHQFDLITAFEVIEHLENWRGLLAEARRLLKPAGHFVVSTPNKSYYAETRGTTGPNPFHTHEFEYAEFEEALYEFFPHVRIWTQNHAAAIIFAPNSPSGTNLEAGASRAPEEAHFFVAVCSDSHAGQEEVFAWVPESGNLLKERERHIAKLEQELARKDQWLATSLEAHSALQKEHESTLEEMRAKNRWATELNAFIAERNSLIVSLQAEVEDQLAWVKQLEERISGLENTILAAQATEAVLAGELAARTNWAQGLEQQLAEKIAHIGLLLPERAELMESLATSNEILERLSLELANTRIALTALQAERDAIAASRWLRLGRALRLGPELRTPAQ